MSTSTSASSVHEGVWCDVCRVSPIVGRRYQCVVCHNYDLCDSCVANGMHPAEHPLLLIRIPHAYTEYMAYTAEQTSIIGAHLDHMMVLRQQGEEELEDMACQELFYHLSRSGLVHLRTQKELREVTIEKCREVLRWKKASMGLVNRAVELLNLLSVDTREEMVEE